MAGHSKRASMREGPLAALFRKTETEGLEDGREPVARAGGPGPDERRDVPHPSLAAPAARPIEPVERLRNAFSSEIPENVLERPAAEPPRDDVFARGDATFTAARVAGRPVIRVVGVGGAGVNAVNRMVEAEVEGVEFVAINTDLQSLQQSTADITVHIGSSITRGLGAGANPDLGRSAAMEEYDKVKALLKGSDLIFIAAGAGGGTGTGAAPIVARIAREVGALTVGIVTKPFGFEGTRRRDLADVGIDTLGSEVDTLIVVPNDRLLTVLDKSTSMVDAFSVADDVLRQGVQGISDLVTLPGLINLDFADVRTIMSEAGPALLGIGMATGPNRAIEAAAQAVASPLLETSMEGARKILLSITGGSDLSLFEVNDAAKAVSEAAHPEANIIFGAMVDEKLAEDQVWVTVVATGYGEPRPRTPRASFEPAGEPRVERRTGGPASAPSMTRRTGMGVTEIDVPEFIPRT
ncbi:MAG TPA: cell division protein FtsZ [Solirubrobacteraceae bacterium]|jgi:cell division protein FtsZ|nr:cell division protein FtsZ [Solirubrobacteraceae bacterium]